MADNSDSKPLETDEEVLFTKREPEKDEDMTNVFATVWVKMEALDDEEHEVDDNCLDVNYKPSRMTDGYRPKKPRIRPRIRNRKRPTITLSCDQCDYTTLYRNCLKLHILCHTNPTPFACVLCPYTTKYPNSLKRHVLLQHHYKDNKETNEPSFKCESCDYTTYLKSNLHAHWRKHKVEKEFRCQHCTYETAYKNSYLKHIKVHNKQEIKFECDKCPFVTKFEGHITRHLAMIHKEVVEKAKKCDYCDFCTITGWRLTIHKNRSKQDNVIKCPHCDFETNYRCESKKHKVVHYNELYGSRVVSSYGVIDGELKATEMIESVGVGKVEKCTENPLNNNVNIPGNRESEAKDNTNKLNTDYNKSVNNTNIFNTENNTNDFNITNTRDFSATNNTKQINAIKNTQSYTNIACTNQQIQEFPANFSENFLNSISYPTQINYTNTMRTDEDCATHFNEDYTADLKQQASDKQSSHEKTHHYLLDPNSENDWNSIQVLESQNKERPFQCVRCKYISKFKASVQRHYQRHHMSNQIRPYKCMNCDFSTKTKDQIALHNKRSQSDTILQCNSCYYTTNFKCQYVIHQRSHYPHKCAVCDYSCRHPYEIRRHFATTHLGEGIKCRFCDFKASRKESVLSHETIHTGNKPFKCDLCSYTSVRKCLLNIHYKRFHIEFNKEVVTVSKSKIDSLKVVIDSNVGMEQNSKIDPQV